MKQMPVFAKYSTSGVLEHHAFKAHSLHQGLQDAQGGMSLQCPFRQGEIG